MATVQNVIYLGLDNPVIITGSFAGEFTSWSDFTRIVLNIGSEVYSTDTTPNQLFINGNELRLKIGDTTALTPGGYPLRIVGYSATYDDGYLLTDKKLGNLPPVIVQSL
jgi:hypothetical protein